MNTRIKELIKAAYDEIPHERDWDSTSLVFNKEKFAKLIVQECIDIAMREDHDPADCIKKHFGVE